MIVKQRSRAGSVDQMDLVGDVRDATAFLVDDMIDTVITLQGSGCSSQMELTCLCLQVGLSGPGNERISQLKDGGGRYLKYDPTTPQRKPTKLTELSVLLAQAIFNIHAKKSISALLSNQVD
jgi:ribose-phosphate pyrophosphokinase